MRDDDFDDERDDDRAPAFPVAVRIAGVIWIAIGALQILSALVNFATAGAANRAGAAPGAAAGQSCGGFAGLLFGVGFLSVGLNTVRGKAKDTLGNSIGSLLLGALCLGIAVLVVAMGGMMANAGPNRPAQPNAGAVAAITAVVLGGVSLFYIVPGVLGLVGRRGYLAWRAATFPTQRRQRRSRGRRDDDDEPR